MVVKSLTFRMSTFSRSSAGSSVLNRCILSMFTRCYAGVSPSEKVLGNQSQHYVKTSHDSSSLSDPKVKVNKAMRAYIERAQAHSLFMKQQTQEFEIGRRHLANMMGEDPETFTQTDINNAIAYLFPSNLFSKRSRPIMKPPEEVFPQQKEAQFGMDGRPFHPFFYTFRPNYYKSLHDIVEWTEKLNAIEDDRVRKGKPPPDKQLSLIGTEWLSKEEVSALWLEKINDHHYRRFIQAMERLLLHPYAYGAEEFVMKFRKKLLAEMIEVQPPEIKTSESGSKYTEAHATKKTCHVWVTLQEGSGKININGQDILFFPRIQDRLQILFPFQYTNTMFRFDLTADVRFGGYSSQAIALREGISKCLTAFIDQEEIERMRQAGLLTHDLRVAERKKYAYTGARGKPKWRKR